MPPAPFAFDGPYGGCYPNAVIPMDRRHVYMLHGVLSAWPFKSALELGSYCGASSAAFIEAINHGSPMSATFCDVSPTCSLFSVVGNCRDQDRTRVFAKPSWAVLESGEDFDFILVDACHDLESVTLELAHLLRRRPLCVMAHDTSATAFGYPFCEGAQALSRAFRADAGYFCIEDCAVRAGEETRRGLFFATTNDELHRLAAGVFEKWR